LFGILGSNKKHQQF